MKQKFIKQFVPNCTFLCMLISIFISNSNTLQAQSDTIKTPIDATTFSSLYRFYTGNIVIAPGGKITTTTNYRFPDGIKEIIIMDGGQIVWGGAYAITLNQNTTLTILNTTITDPENPNAPLTVNGCNNNTSLYLGSVKYSACRGQGNVCFLVSRVIEMGGTVSLKTNVNVSVTNGQLVDGKLCSKTPNNESFTLEASITRDQDFINDPTITWSIVESPLGVNSPQIEQPNSLTTPINVYGAGNYVFRITMAQSIATAGCATVMETVTKTADVNVQINQSPDATLTGGGTLRNDANPIASVPININGTNGNGEYTFKYLYNDKESYTVKSTTGSINIEKYSNESSGVHKFELIEVADNQCISAVTNQIAYVLIHNALPIELIDFNIMSDQCTNQITWTTGNEEKFNVFELQISEDEGTTFNTIAIIKGNGNNSKYNFQHNIKDNKRLLYRLKSVDLDGMYAYSKIVNASSSCDQYLPKIVNPITNKTLVIHNIIPSTDEVTVYDVNGKVISVKKASKPSFHLNLEQHNSGIYIVKITRNNELLLMNKVLLY